MRAAEPLAWDQLMGFGLGVLRLPPAAFWSMTLPELAAAMTASLPNAPGALGKDELAALMRRYPDA